MSGAWDGHDRRTTQSGQAGSRCYHGDDNVAMSDEQLTTMSARELNRCLRGLSRDKAATTAHAEEPRLRGNFPRETAHAARRSGGGA